MNLFFEILDGQMEGMRSPVRDGMIIGRKEGDLTIKDSKISSKHVRVEKRAGGALWLVDLGSSNGIKVGEDRLREVELKEGLEFVLGRTSFRLVAEKSRKNKAEAPPPENEDSENAAAPESATVTRTFWDALIGLAEKGSRAPAKPPREVAAFTSPLHLKFTKGIQTGTEWIIGYGPRLVGSSSVDLALEDSTLPGLCFRLLPEHNGVLFKNESEQAVKLNGKWVESEFLKPGDVIDIKSTQIIVEFE